MDKSCSGCKQTKEVSEFYKDKGKSSGYASECKICSGIRVRQFDLKKYGITNEIYLEMAKSQNFNCKICGKPELKRKTLDIDHCHETGTVRGLLCGPCNMGLGLFKDNIELLRKAAEYLGKTK